MDDSNESRIAYINLIIFSSISESNLVNAPHSNDSSSYQLHDKKILQIAWKRKNKKYPEKLVQFCENQNISPEISALETPYHVCFLFF